MSRTSNDAAPGCPLPRQLSAAEIGALADPDLVPHLAGTLPPNLPAGQELRGGPPPPGGGGGAPRSSIRAWVAAMTPGFGPRPSRGLGGHT
jgi:hypothetical protein